MRPVSRYSPGRAFVGWSEPEVPPPEPIIARAPVPTRPVSRYSPSGKLSSYVYGVGTTPPVADHRPVLMCRPVSIYRPGGTSPLSSNTNIPPTAVVDPEPPAVIDYRPVLMCRPVSIYRPGGTAPLSSNGNPPPALVSSYHYAIYGSVGTLSGSVRINRGKNPPIVGTFDLTGSFPTSSTSSGVPPTVLPKSGFFQVF